MMNATLNEMPNAENPHVRLGGEKVAPTTSGRGALRYTHLLKCAVAACAVALVGNVLAASPLQDKIAAEHKIISSSPWGGGNLIKFDFNGRTAWVVEPATPAAGNPWCWTMQWMGAYLERTGAPELVAKKGWYHVHLEAFDTKANAEGLKALAAYQDYLVKTLGFAPKVHLIGMSWGGFYSIRYANAYPQNVANIYLDAPLLCFKGFPAGAIGTWGKDAASANDTWADDPRMPVNMAESIARAGIPVLLLYGGQDQTVNPKLNCELFVKRFKAAGGDIVVKNRGLYGHHPHGAEHGDPVIVNFFTNGPTKK